MQIGQIVRGLIGDVKAGEAKQLELRPGQVVRGVVTQVADDGAEALVNIQGVQVKAKLETPLSPGQMTTMQVQPDTVNGMVVLKPLSSAGQVMLSEQTMGEVLKSVGMPDQKWSRELLRLMQQNGIALTKENTEQMRLMLAKLPQGVTSSEWLQASALAMNRGLPLTQETVKALHQVLFGKPVSQLLTTLAGQLDELLARAPQDARGTGPAPPTAGGAGQAQAPAASAGGAVRPQAAPLLTQAAALLRELAAAALPAAPAPGGAAAGQAAAAPPQALAQAAQGGGAPSAAASGSAPAAQAALPSAGAAASAPAAAPGAASALAAPAAPAPAPTTPPVQAAPPPMPGQAAGMNSPVPSSTTTALGGSFAAADTANLTGSHSGASPAANSITAEAAAREAAASGAHPTTNAAAAKSAEAQASTSGAPQHANVDVARTDQNLWVGRVLKLLGVEHEQSVLRAIQTGSSSNANPMNNAPLVNETQLQWRGQPHLASVEHPDMIVPQGGNTLSSSTNAHAATDNLKSVLMQLAQADDVPVAVKETAQQLVAQITGQQLMLSSDRSAAFAHVSLFIPLTTQDGDEAATVHIQTRQGKRGELDASNCHLWFDLQFKTLGRTIADVQVVDRIVSLKLHNDQPWLAEIVQARRPELESAISAVGYQLLSITSAPLPERQTPTFVPEMNAPTAAFTPSAYKGVDLRV